MQSPKCAPAGNQACRNRHVKHSFYTASINGTDSVCCVWPLMADWLSRFLKL